VIAESGAGRVRQKTQLITVLGLGLALAPTAYGLTLDLPAPVLSEETRNEVPGSYELPTGPFAGGTLPTRTVEGAVVQRAWQLDAPDRTTLAVLDPLRQQVIAAGFEVLLDCAARACGGFDFRYATEVLPEPDMHVDLGDFRFLSALRGDEAISILVSRSALLAYVQITQVSAAPQDGAGPSEPALPVIGPKTGAVLDPPAQPDGEIGAALEQAGSIVLADLDFASGAATLTEGDYPSLAALAGWLAANPEATIALVGHTDASGSLAANIAISERRAEAVAKVLIDSYGVARDRITAKGVGFLAPRASNRTDEGRQKNRRVEAVVTSTR
jgi:outer membrane protein OmpA-like peptidoglycan-associated protein